jgi:amidophosphoribosyltransferase
MSGIFCVVNRKKDCFELLLYSTGYHSHLRTEYDGIAVLGREFLRKIHHIGQLQFKSKLYEDYDSIY